MKNKIILISGIQCSGKTTLAYKLKEKLPYSVIIDADDIRNTISKHLGFSYEDIKKHMTNMADIAKIIHKQGFNVILTCCSPYKELRNYIRNYIGKEHYSEIHCYADKHTIENRRKIIHPNTPILHNFYETSDYNTIKVNTTVNNNIDNIVNMIKENKYEK